MSLEASSRQNDRPFDQKNVPESAVNPQHIPSRKECIESVAIAYLQAFPNLSLANIQAPDVLLSVLHHLGEYLRGISFDFYQPYASEQVNLQKDAKAVLAYTKQRSGHSLSENEEKQRLNGWAGEMVVKFLLDVVYQCAEQQGVTNVPHRHHHNDRESIFPKNVASALNLHIRAQYGAGRFVRFDPPSPDAFYRQHRKCEIDLLAGDPDHVFLIDVTTDPNRVQEKLHHSPNSPLSDLRTCLEQMRYKAFNIVCAVTPTIDKPVVARDHQGRNYAGTVPLHSQVEDFAQRYLTFMQKN